VGVIGNIGSGKSTFARLLTQQLQGSVIVQANSARYLLRKGRHSWGENVRELVWEMTRRYSNKEYIPIVDGGLTERGARDQLCRIASAHGIPLWFVRMTTSTETCLKRTREKYENPHWADGFAECRVNATYKIVANVRKRANLHESLRKGDIDGLVAQVNNDPVRAYIARAASYIAEELRTNRRTWRLQFF
jgi:predicted kinase